jgi:hypothetical protein
MTESVEAGWSFEEALAKTSDPLLWDRYQAESRQQTPTSADLRRSLIAELLTKIGRRLFAAVPKLTNSVGGWTSIGRVALEEKIARERIEDTRLFAPLKAPNAIERLKDRGLAEVFQQDLLDDPEVVVLLKRNGTPDLFEGGRAPGWCVRYHWPLEPAAPDLAWLMEGGIFIMGGPERTPTREVSMLSEAVVDRISILRGLLVSGKIRAFGLSNHFGESFIPARQWARKDMSIDVASGDLGQQDIKGDFLPLWTGIEFRSAITDVISNKKAVQGVDFSTRKRSPRGQEVEHIINENGIDVEKLGRKAAASEVMRYMRKPPESENEKKALEALVGRISRAISRTA